MQIRYQVQQNQLSLPQAILDAKYTIKSIDEQVHKCFYTGAISNDLKYIFVGDDVGLLTIWKYKTNDIMKCILIEGTSPTPYSCKFTDDSQILYVGFHKKIYQFSVKCQFKKLCKMYLHRGSIQNIYCINNSIILTSSQDQTIIKTDVNKRQQLLRIQAHIYDYISALDYNKIRNMIASGSSDAVIKLWNGNHGSLIINKMNPYDNQIQQLLFITDNNQIISLDDECILIIWNIKYEIKQLEQEVLQKNSGYNISLALSQSFIILIGVEFIKVYTIKGNFIRQFNHQVDDFLFFNTIQCDSLEAVLIQGCNKLQICKLLMN